MALIDLEGGAESDGQAGQNVAALHEKEGLAVDFLMRGRGVRGGGGGGGDVGRGGGGAKQRGRLSVNVNGRSFQLVTYCLRSAVSLVTCRGRFGGKQLNSRGRPHLRPEGGGLPREPGRCEVPDHVRHGPVQRAAAGLLALDAPVDRVGGAYILKGFEMCSSDR